MKILVVDDEVEFASTLAERLCLRGYDALAAFKARDVVDMVKEHDPDVVLLDLKMPDSDGIHILRDVKDVAPRTVVIMLTGHGDPDVVNAATASGAADYVMKPINIDELRKKINKAVSNSENIDRGTNT